jgi:hypothetical protein
MATVGVAQSGFERDGYGGGADIDDFHGWFCLGKGTIVSSPGSFFLKSRVYDSWTACGGLEIDCHCEFSLVLG